MAAVVAGVGVRAADDNVFTRIHHSYQSSRAIGMGDAFVAVSDDYSTLFYNPAGLARLEDGQINLSLELAASKSFSEFAKDSKDLGDSGTDSEKYQRYSDFLNSRYGSYYQLRTSLLNGIWVRPHWGIGVIPIDMTLELGIHKQGVPALDVRAYADTTLAMGYGRDIKGLREGRLSWGVTGKFVNRAYYSNAFNALDLAVDSNLLKSTDAREGYTIDADLGLLYTPVINPEGWGGMVLTRAKPTFGIVARNIMEAGFKNSLKLVNKNGGGEPPEKLYRVLDIGTKFELPTLWIFGGRAVFDIRDINHPQYNLRKATHMGAEFDWAVASWWKGQYRFGVNQGYFTAGISALFAVFRIDFATYGEDVGSLGAPKENRMYLLKLNLDF